MAYVPEWDSLPFWFELLPTVFDSYQVWPPNSLPTIRPDAASKPSFMRFFISNPLNNTSHLSSSPIDHQSWLREPVSRVSCMRLSFSRVSSREKPLHSFITLIQVSSSSLEDCSVKTGRKSREDCAQVTSTAGTYVELMATSGGRMMVRSLESGFLHLKLNLFFFLFARRS